MPFSSWQQIALFVLPYVCVRRGDVWTDSLRSFTVTLGWIMGKPLTLLFDPFESIALFLSGEALSYYHSDPIFPLTGVSM